MTTIHDDLVKIRALMRISERVTLEGSALANVLAELDEAARMRPIEQRAREEWDGLCELDALDDLSEIGRASYRTVSYIVTGERRSAL